MICHWEFEDLFFPTVNSVWFLAFIWGLVALKCCLSSCCTTSESATCVNTSSPAWTSLPLSGTSHSTYLCHHKAPSWASWAIKQVPTSCFTHGTAHTSTCLPGHPCPHPPGPHVHSLSFLALGKLGMSNQGGLAEKDASWSQESSEIWYEITTETFPTPAHVP